jgi:hypothetical protein
MNRRAFVTGLGAVVAGPLAAEAQPPGKIWRVGFLSGGARLPDGSLPLPLRQGLVPAPERHVEVQSSPIGCAAAPIWSTTAVMSAVTRSRWEVSKDSRRRSSALSADPGAMSRSRRTTSEARYPSSTASNLKYLSDAGQLADVGDANYDGKLPIVPRSPGSMDGTARSCRLSRY